MSDEVKAEENTEGIFQGNGGSYSMRRLLAFIFAIAAIIGGGFAIFRGLDWKVIAAISGIFCTSSLLLMFFTTWSDVSSAIAKVRKND